MSYSPMPKGDKVHQMPQPGNVNRQAYPDKPADVRNAQKRNIANVNKGKAKEGYRH